MIIEDGTGAGKTLKVDSNNQAHVFAASEPYQGFISRVDKGAFVFSTGFLTISNTASENAVLYIKYTGNKYLRIQQVRSCGNAMDSYNKVVLRSNPTGGTIISDASAAYSTNMNLESNADFNGLVYVGGNSKTQTGGTWMTQFIDHLAGHSLQGYSGGLILGKNDSIVFTMQPGASGDCCMEVQAYESEKVL